LEQPVGLGERQVVDVATRPQAEAAVGEDTDAGGHVGMNLR
jgi:hypothetical protein